MERSQREQRARNEKTSEKRLLGESEENGGGTKH